ncbi:MAG: glycosyltransferase family 2 protein [Bifidobacteriaceae bacterium]|jgi:glycosyltransferase involved in cell wall biosynthesis|nr:glycosyltransferase family 2 protein [Bifidobacteriaceae bacterium]
MNSVSVVIPAYNEEENIERCLESCVKQSIAPFEVLVVNNRSTDQTEKLVQRFIDKSGQTNIKLLQQDKLQGMQPTIRFGLNNATGEILGRIDGDSILEEHWVEKVSTAFTKNPNLGGVSGPVSYYDMPFASFSLQADRLGREINSAFMKEYPFLFGSNMAISKKAWETIKGQVCEDLDDKFHEDIDLALHLKFNHFDIEYYPEMIAYISARRIDNKLSDFRDYTKRFSRTYKAHGIHKVSLKFPEFFLMTIYFPLHALKKFYTADISQNLNKIKKSISTENANGFNEK